MAAGRNPFGVKGVLNDNLFLHDHNTNVFSVLL